MVFLSFEGGDKHCGIRGGSVGLGTLPTGACLAFKAQMLCPDGVCPGSHHAQDSGVPKLTSWGRGAASLHRGVAQPGQQVIAA